MLESARILLKLLELDDEAYIVKWRNQKEIINNMFNYKGVTIEEHRNWFKNYLLNDNRIEFIIIVKESGKRIGTIGLSDIDFRNQKAEYGILIGEESELGKGYGYEASKEIIKYGFKELNLKKIYLKTFIDNKKAIKLYDRLGFIKEGVLRKEIFKKGEHKDVVLMSILKDEWTL